MMCDEVLKQPLPIASGPLGAFQKAPVLASRWTGTRYGIHEQYRQHGQFHPYGERLI